jgi:hypothetical protein
MLKFEFRNATWRKTNKWSFCVPIVCIFERFQIFRWSVQIWQLRWFILTFRIFQSICLTNCLNGTNLKLKFFCSNFDPQILPLNSALKYLHFEYILRSEPGFWDYCTLCLSLLDSFLCNFVSFLVNSLSFFFDLFQFC